MEPGKAGFLSTALARIATALKVLATHECLVLEHVHCQSSDISKSVWPRVARPERCNGYMEPGKADFLSTALARIATALKIARLSHSVPLHEHG